VTSVILSTQTQKQKKKKKKKNTIRRACVMRVNDLLMINELNVNINNT